MEVLIILSQTMYAWVLILRFFFKEQRLQKTYSSSMGYPRISKGIIRHNSNTAYSHLTNLNKIHFWEDHKDVKIPKKFGALAMDQIRWKHIPAHSGYI